MAENENNNRAKDYDKVVGLLYYIPEGNKDVFKFETDFVIYFKESLKDIIQTFWNSTNGPEEHDKYMPIALEKTVDLGLKLEEFMQTTNQENLMRRLYLMNDIEVLIDSRKNYIEERSNRPKGYNDLKIDDIMSSLKRFLLYTGSVPLIENGKLEELNNKYVVNTADRLMTMVKSNFFNYIEEDNLYSSDIFLLLGYLTVDAEETYNHMINYTNAHCENCNIDDCMVSHCHIFDSRLKKEVEIKDAEQRRDLCCKVVEGENVDPKEIDKVAQKISEPGLKKIFINLLTGRSSPGLRTISLDFNNRLLYLIPEGSVGAQFYRNLSLGKGVDLRNADDIAIQVLLENFDFSLCMGSAIYDNFVSKQKKNDSYIAGSKEQKPYYYALITQLIDLYEEAKIEIKEEYEANDLFELERIIRRKKEKSKLTNNQLGEEE